MAKKTNNSIDIDAYGLEYTDVDTSWEYPRKLTINDRLKSGLKFTKRLLSIEPQVFTPIRTESKNLNKRRLIIAVILCFSFFAIELAGGLYANSLALVADACHLLTDAATYLLSLISIIISQRKATTKYGFGFARAEVLGALLSILMIWGLITMLMTEAVDKLRNPPLEMNGQMMLILSCLAFGVNILLLTVLNSGGHGNQKDQKNINVRAAITHAIGDLIFSVGVIIASIVIIYNPSCKWIDPFCTFVFSIVVLYTTAKVLKEILVVLMQGTTFNYSPIIDEIQKLPNVVGVSEMNVWHLTAEELVATCHVSVNDMGSLHIQRQVISILENNGIKRHTVQLNSALQ